ncbi:MAG: O-antigen ligase family protein [Bacteroidetes bacterium]|nr:O-antigen ligase family protein [Bacteroidota bacterium]
MNSELKIVHRVGVAIFFFGVILTAFSMPLWNLGMSLGQFTMAGGWLLAGNLKSRLQFATKQTVFWLLVGLFLMHVLGLWNTTDFKYAMRDITVKLPLLLMPLLIAAGPRLTVKQVRILFHFLFLGVMVSTITGWATYQGWTGKEVRDFRDLSVFISHNRLSLLIDVCIVMCLYYANEAKTNIVKLGYGLLTLWCLYFLILLQSITGLLLLAILFTAAIVYFGIKSKNKGVKIATSVFLLMILFAGWKSYDTIFVQSIQSYEGETNSNLKFTARGNVYQNDWSRQDVEGGRLVWRKYNELEIDTAWMTRSTQRVWELDQQGHMQLVTLMRYLTFKNLSKDAAGVQQLSEKDVQLIEKGFPTPEAVEGKSSIQYRLKELASEYRNYHFRNDANGHSLAQRLEYWKASKNIIQKYPLTGVGTGDVPDAFQDMYVEMNSNLEKTWRLRAHNQYLSFGVAFGWPGLLFFIFVLLFSIRHAVQQQNYIYLAFLIIAMGSFFNEDTLETQAGVTFFAFLNSIFLWKVYKSDDSN